MDKETFELIMSAQVNFENLVAQNPAIATHPMYAIAKMQLDKAIEKLVEAK